MYKILFIESGDYLYRYNDISSMYSYSYYEINHSIFYLSNNYSHICCEDKETLINFVSRTNDVRDNFGNIVPLNLNSTLFEIIEVKDNV